MESVDPAVGEKSVELSSVPKVDDDEEGAMDVDVDVDVDIDIEDDGCFFADATLDLEDAHHIAEEDEDDNEENKENKSSDQQGLDDLVPPSSSLPSSLSSMGISSKLTSLSYAHNESDFYDKVLESPVVPPPRYRPRPPRYCRDGRYTLLFFVAVPLSLLSSGSSTTTSLVATGLVSSVRFVLIASAVAAVGPMARILYHYGRGRNSRSLVSESNSLENDIQMDCSSLMLMFSSGTLLAWLDRRGPAWSMLASVGMTVAIFVLTPSMWVLCTVPLWWLSVDVLVRRRLGLGRLASVTGHGGAWGSLDRERRVAWRATAELALEVLGYGTSVPSSSRPRPGDVRLRTMTRPSPALGRTVWAVLAVQVFYLWVWTASYWRADVASRILWVVPAALWTRAFLGRVLGHVASGAVTCWFVHRHHQVKDGEENDNDDNNNNNNTNTTANNHNNDEFYDPDRVNINEAYHSVDASAYSSAQAYDDYDEEEEDEVGLLEDGMLLGEEEFDHAVPGQEPWWGADVLPTSSSSSSSLRQRTLWSMLCGGGNCGGPVRSFLLSSLTVSLGSVLKCALLATLSQWVDFAFRHALAGAADSNNNNNTQRRSSVAIIHRLHNYTKRFIVTNDEYGMTHVAAYYKSYHRASLDVSALLKGTGVDPHITRSDDISYAMGNTIANALAMTVAVAYLLWSVSYSSSHPTTTASLTENDNNNNNNNESVTITLHTTTTRTNDATICHATFLVYALVYATVLTCLEPLRAAIQAVYVAFAHCPEGLQQTSPLVYQRLRRIADGGVQFSSSSTPMVSTTQNYPR